MSTLAQTLQRAGFSAAPVDRRRQPRLQVRQRVRLRALSDDAPWNAGVVVDCSGSGLGLQTGQPLEEGAYVLIDWNAGYFVGVVRNCQETGADWRIGVELEYLRAWKSLVLELMETTITEPQPAGGISSTLP